MKQLLISILFVAATVATPLMADDVALDEAGLQKSIMAFGVSAEQGQAAAQVVIKVIEESQAADTEAEAQEGFYAKISDDHIDNPYAY